jgi:hypothetical protein
VVPVRIKRKMEFSKKIFVGIAIGTIAIVIFSLVIVWRTGDTSPLAYIIPATFAELATATGFYYRKAEKENTKGGIVYDAALGQQNPSGDEQCYEEQ